MTSPDPNGGDSGGGIPSDPGGIGQGLSDLFGGGAAGGDSTTVGGNAAAGAGNSSGGIGGAIADITGLSNLINQFEGFMAASGNAFFNTIFYAAAAVFGLGMLTVGLWMIVEDVPGAPAAAVKGSSVKFGRITRTAAKVVK